MSLRSDTAASGDVAKLAFRFVLIIGVVNFFADMTYEGARSIVGPFLGSLGASAAVVGFVGSGRQLAIGSRVGCRRANGTRHSPTRSGVNAFACRPVHRSGLGVWLE